MNAANQQTPARLLVLSKTDALGDQLLATGLVHDMLEAFPSARVVWFVRRGYEAIGTLLPGATVFRANCDSAPDAEARRLLNLPPQETGPVWSRLIFVPITLNAYAAPVAGQDWVAETSWWIDFVRGLGADWAVAGTVTLNWIDQALVFASGARRRIGFEPGDRAQSLPGEIGPLLEARQLRAGFTKTLPSVLDRHESDSFAELARAVTGRSCKCAVRLEIDLKEEPASPPIKQPLVLAPGAGDVKRIYPLKKLAEVVHRLGVQRGSSWDEVMVLCGPQDGDICTDLIQKLSAHGINARLFKLGPHDLRPAAVLLQKARLLICNDSFWAHLASTVGTPTVALWGLGHWGRFVPREGRVTVLYLDMICRHCDWLCCFQERRCITDIPVEAVVSAAQARLLANDSPIGIQTLALPGGVDEAKIRAALLQQAHDGEAHHRRADNLQTRLNVANELLSQTEKQRDALNQARELEAIEKEKTRTLLQAETEAHQHWESICHAAEDQLAEVREKLAAEIQAAQVVRERLRQAERQRDALNRARELEAAEKEKLHALLQTEIDACQHWQQLCRAAERQREALNQARELEAAEKEKIRALLQTEIEARENWERLAREADHQRDTERNLREAEGRAKAAALHWAGEAERIKGIWTSLCHEAEGQRDGLQIEVQARQSELEKATAKIKALEAEVMADAGRLAQVRAETAQMRSEQNASQEELGKLEARAAQSKFTHHLAVEQARQQMVRQSLLGRGLALANAMTRTARQLYCFVRRKPRVRSADGSALRIALVNTHDLIGGAERTSYDLHTNFRHRGLLTTLIVGGKYGTDSDVFKVPFRDIDWKHAPVWRDRWGLTEILYPTPVLGCFKWPQLRQADVVNIHNMHGHYWSSLTLLPLGFQHPVVLTLHDEYTLTGDCCYSYECMRWQHTCGRCPLIGLERSARYALGERDLTRLNVLIKRGLFRSPRAYPLAIVTPTEWLANRARRSPNLRHLPIVCINNGIDLDYWKPLPQLQARTALGLPHDKTIGLLVASYLQDRRKGLDIALDSIRALPEDGNLLFVIVGHLNDEIRSKLVGLPVIATDYVSDKNKMLHLFSAADFTFSMSRVDNLPYMCVESLACGRPVFGSAVGGIPEIVDNPRLGWLTPVPFETSLIVATLLEIDREPPAVRLRRFAACRRSAEARFSLELMTNRYLALYGELLAASRKSRPVELAALARVGA